MGVFAGPKISKDKISMLVDVQNTKSYPGSGTSWFDLVNKKTFASQNTQTPFTTQNGNKCFQFNSSGYWQTTNSSNDEIDMGGDCTLLIWMYHETNDERDTIFEKVSVSGNQSYQDEIAVTLETNGRFTWYSRKTPNYDVGSTSYTFTDNAWHLLGIKMSTGRTATARTGFYSQNGQPWVSNYNSRSDTALVSAGAVRIGGGYAGALEDGKIVSVTCYNKMLSDDEVADFYNATRTRFGL